MQNTQVRRRGATRPSLLMGVQNGGDLAPGRANNFRRKCSEYTGQARCTWARPAPAAITRRRP